VVVAGGGLAGLSAALECADIGARVTLVERRSRLGGLTASFAHRGLVLDNGQHVFLACCEEYQRFLGRIGSAGDVEPPRPLDLPVVAPGPKGPVVGRLRRADLPVPLHLAGSLLRYPHTPLADRLRLGLALAALARVDPHDPAADRVSFGRWLADHHQSPQAVAAVWDLITVPTVNLPAAEASLAVAAMVMKTGLLGARAAADIGWSRVPLGSLHGEAAARALARAGVSVCAGTRVTRIDAGPDGFWLCTPGGPLAADAVIVALPPEEAAGVLPVGSHPDQSRWASLGHSAIVDVHLEYDRRVCPWDFFAGHRSTVQWVFDRTSASGLDRVRPGHQLLAVSLSAADRFLALRPATVVSAVTAALADLLPAVASARLVDALVTKERRATFAARPGTAALRPAGATRLPGLALAGAWTATGWPATMEGAVRSGRAAARLLAALGPSTLASPQPLPDHTPQEVA
jgi:squalene-associated FAD-dependent desaturase